MAERSPRKSVICLQQNRPWFESPFNQHHNVGGFLLGGMDMFTCLFGHSSLCVYVSLLGKDISAKQHRNHWLVYITPTRWQLIHEIHQTKDPRAMSCNWGFCTWKAAYVPGWRYPERDFTNNFSCIKIVFNEDVPFNCWQIVGKYSSWIYFNGYKLQFQIWNALY